MKTGFTFESLSKGLFGLFQGMLTSPDMRILPGAWSGAAVKHQEVQPQQELQGMCFHTHSVCQL